MNVQTPIRVLSIAVAFTSAVGLGILSVTAASPHQRPPREITPNGQPLADRVKPDDTDVTISGRFSRPMKVHAPAGTSPVVWELNGMSALVVKLRPSASELTEKGDWISTKWSGDITQVLRLAPGHPFSVGGTVQFVHQTGDIQIGKASVHARYSWARDLKPGESYLMFVNWDVANSIAVVGPGTEYRILSDGSLEHVDTMPDEISKMTFQQVSDEVRAWVRAHGG